MKNILHKFILISSIAALILFIVAVGAVNNERVIMDEGLELYYNGVDMHIDRLSESNISIKKKGDIVSVRGVFPDNIPDRSTMVVTSYHSVVNVKVEDEMIFSYGEEYKDKNLMAGDGLYNVTIPEHSGGKKFEIIYEACDDDAFSFSDPIGIYKSGEVAFQYIRRQFLEVGVSTFAFMLGLSMVILQLSYGRFDKQFRKVLWLGVIFMLAGVWIASYYGSVKIVVNSNHFIAYIEHFSLYAALIPLICFFMEEAEKRIHKILLSCALVVSILFVVFVAGAEVTGIAHPNTYIYFFQIIGCVSMALIFYISLNKGENDKLRRMTLLGICVFGLSFILEMVVYRINKTGTGADYDESFIVPIGVFIFIITEMVSYLYYILKYSKKSVQEEVLFTLANKDLLTGLANRNACEKYMHVLDEKDIGNYAIVNFDLNWLKKINDTYGHTAGDEYISGFASLLDRYFGGTGKVGRMGGDEFIAILTNTDIAFIEERLEAMSKCAATYGNKNYENGEIFFAYGYAVSTEREPLPTHKVFEMADARMYQCKREQKACRD